MFSKEFVIKQKRSRYLFPKTYSTSKAIQNLFPSPLPSLPQPFHQNQKTSKATNISKSSEKFSAQIQKDSKFLEKSSGPNSPLCSKYETLPNIIKNFTSFEGSAFSTIHSSQSRFKSQKAFACRNQGMSSEAYSPHKDFHVILVGHKCLEEEKRIK
jgi:hypothetical protein